MFILMLFTSVGIKSIHVHEISSKWSAPVSAASGVSDGVQLSKQVGDCPICEFTLPTVEKPVIQNSVAFFATSQVICVSCQQMPSWVRYISLNAHSPPAVA